MNAWFITGLILAGALGGALGYVVYLLLEDGKQYEEQERNHD